MPREYAIDLIEVDLGSKFSSTINANTDFLIIGEKPESKLSKARALGVKVIDEDELLLAICDEKEIIRSDNDLEGKASVCEITIDSIVGCCHYDEIDKISKVSKRIDQKHLYEQDDDEQPQAGEDALGEVKSDKVAETNRRWPGQRGLSGEIIVVVHRADAHNVGDDKGDKIRHQGCEKHCVDDGAALAFPNRKPAVNSDKKDD